MGIDLPIQDSFLQFTLVVAAVLVVQLTLERSWIPGLVGLLVFGMAVGPGGLALLPDGPVVEFLGTVGLLYIMFLAGLEVDLEVVSRHKREAAGFGLLALGLSFFPALAVGLLIGLPWPGALLLGAALSSHTLLSYPIIERLRLLHRRSVVATIGGTLLTDTMALIVLVTVMALAAEGDESGPGGLWPLLFLVVLVVAALAAVPPVARYVLERAKATRAERALFLLVALLLLSTAADLIGTEDILGAFLAGVCLNRALQRQEKLREHVTFVGRMIFIPFFFVETGMRLELSAFTEPMTWLMSAALIGVVAGGKSAASWIAGKMFGYPTIERAVMTGLSLPQAAATLAVTVTAAEAGLMGAELIDAVIVTIFVTCLAGALLTRYAGGRARGRDERGLLAEDGEEREIAPTVADPGSRR